MTDGIRRSYYRVVKRKQVTPKGLVMIKLLNEKGDINLGYALCDKHDHFSYKAANKLASEKMANQAASGTTLNLFNIASINAIMSSIPHSLHDNANFLIFRTAERLNRNYIRNLRNQKA